MNFFIATIGRSGSTWLSALLNQSPTHTVMHEEADTRDPMYIHPHSQFPIKRFAKPNYGEVQGFLRYQLSATCPGPERLIPRRALLRRETKSVIKSWMNRDYRQIDELSAVIFEVVTQQRLLDMWAASDPEVRTFRFENLTTNLEALKELCSWLEIDLVPTDEQMREVKNPNDPAQHLFDWDEKSNELYDRIASRQKKRSGYSS